MHHFLVSYNHGGRISDKLGELKKTSFRVNPGLTHRRFVSGHTHRVICTYVCTCTGARTSEEGRVSGEVKGVVEDGE